MNCCIESTGSPTGTATMLGVEATGLMGFDGYGWAATLKENAMRKKEKKRLHHVVRPR